MKMKTFVFKLPAACLCVLAALMSASAWGPHRVITASGLAALGPDDPFLKHLGKSAVPMPVFALMGDRREMLLNEAEGPYYADDYLIFPGMARHPSHMCPDVMEACRPHFFRALQALRTETPLNAARWTGSLLHFVEDTGAPPHAAGVSGPLHSTMENWVKAAKIKIPRHHPALLGETDDEAMEALARRLVSLRAFSAERAARSRPFLLAGNRAATEPIILESALETTRLVADVTHTLGYLASKNPPGRSVLRGRVLFAAAPGFKAFPAKIILLGTAFSTLTDAGGRFEFRQLPAGSFQLAVLRPGNEVLATNIVLSPSAGLNLHLAMQPALVRDNLLRNPDFSAKWVENRQPAGWRLERQPDKRMAWESERLPVQAGHTYLLSADWRPEAMPSDAVIAVRWCAGGRKDPVMDQAALVDGGAARTLVAPSRMPWAQIILYTDREPGNLWNRLSFTAAKGKDK